MFEGRIHKSIKRKCVICESFIDGFLPWQDKSNNEFTQHLGLIGSDTTNFSCPNCGATDRERHLYLYMKELGLLQKLAAKKMLVIAPEAQLVGSLRKFGVDLTLGDAYPESFGSALELVRRIDLTDTRLPENEFDIVMANHVLEHIPDYKQAISEIYRILVSGGIAILQTPFSSILYNNFEDANINTLDLRRKYYGQHDHVRVFGLKLFEDIKNLGFSLKIYRHDDILKQYDAHIYGVNLKESLIIAQKSEAK